MKPSLPRRVWAGVGSLQMTLACLAGLTLIVTLCTLSQAKLGVYQAVELYIRSLVIYAPIGGANIPVLPGGGLVGGLLLLNLAATQTRLERSWRKGGLWIVHLGLILLFLGEFVSGFVRREAQLSIGRGQTLDYAQDSRHVELALIDETDPASDRVYAVSESVLRRHGEVGRPALPLRLRVHQFAQKFHDEAVEDAQADVEIAENPLSTEGGRWIVSMSGEQGVRFSAGGRRYRLALRPRRTQLPVALTLHEFQRETYPGTDIPRSFSSRVLVREPNQPASRPALISMNNPLRVAGFVFYQAGFAQDDRVSILQVVDNPAWPLPYLSCALVSLGLLVHFLRRLSLYQAARS